MISAAITPGIHPQMVRIKTIKMEPQPLSMTARGGNKIDRRTLQMLISRIIEVCSAYWSKKHTFVTAANLYIFVLVWYVNSLYLLS